MRNPSMWYSENPELERALEHAATLRDDWIVANRGRAATTNQRAAGSAGLARGLRLTIGQAAIAIGRAIGGDDLVEDEADAADGWAKAA